MNTRTGPRINRVWRPLITLHFGMIITHLCARVRDHSSDVSTELDLFAGCKLQILLVDSLRRFTIFDSRKASVSFLLLNSGLTITLTPTEYSTLFLFRATLGRSCYNQAP